MKVPLAFLAGAIAVGILMGSLGSPRAETYDEMVERHSARDPERGFKVDLSPTVERQLTGRTLILLLGDCAECTIKSGDLLRLDYTGWHQIIAATRTGATPQGILPPTVHALELLRADELHDQLNAFWTPRLAIIDRHGELLALQSKSQTASQFLTGNQP